MSDEVGDAAEFGLLVAFPDPSASFVHGFEAGMVWAKMEAGEAEIGSPSGLPMHSANLKVFRSMASAKGYDVEVKSTDLPEWSDVLFRRSGRGRLSVIDGGAL